MPMLDVTECLVDPMFCENISVTRRAATVGNDGLNSITTSTVPIIGVITIGGLEDYAIETDAERAKDRIVVHSITRLLEPSDGYLPDLVPFDGKQYSVRKVYNYSHYGAGFYANECDIINTTLESPT
jgi:hypothetical protein